MRSREPENNPCQRVRLRGLCGLASYEHTVSSTSPPTFMRCISPPPVFSAKLGCDVAILQSMARQTALSDGTFVEWFLLC